MSALYQATMKNRSQTAIGFTIINFIAIDFIAIDFKEQISRAGFHRPDFTAHLTKAFGFKRRLE